MKSVGDAGFKGKLFLWLRAIRRSAEVLVTERYRLSARIAPAVTTERAFELRPPKVPFASVRDRRTGSAGWPLRSDDVLAVERADR